MLILLKCAEKPSNFPQLILFWRDKPSGIWATKSKATGLSNITISSSITSSITKSTCLQFNGPDNYDLDEWEHSQTNLQVVVGWNFLLQEHLSQDFIGISHTLHQLLPPVCSLNTKICRDLISLIAASNALFSFGLVGLLWFMKVQLFVASVYDSRY